MHRRTFLRNVCNKFLNTRKYCKAQVEAKEPIFIRRIFSGIQPTGSIHLGNYLGAIAQWVKLQNNNEDMIISIVDLHSMTLPHNPQQLSDNIVSLTATLLGCGVDPNKVILFQQSMVPAHTQLCWYLSCISTMARLAHLPTYKEKSSGLKDIPLGLFVYPVLQAADILCYKATHVPVGEDQAQNIQLAQDLARMFNSRYGVTFPWPHAIVTGSEYARLKSLRDPNKKMSKSDPDPKSKICLSDSPDHIMKNIKKAVTDFTSEVTYNPTERPGVSNLISIHAFVTNKSVEEICKAVENVNTGQYKLIVAEAVIEYLKPIQTKTAQILNDKQYIMNVLNEGAEKASEIALVNLEEVKRKLGLNFDVSNERKLEIKL